MSEQMDPSRVNSIAELDMRGDSEHKFPNLRAMGFGELLDTTFSLYRKHFWSFLGVSAGYCPAMLIMISVFLLDDPLGRGPKVAIWIPMIGVFWGISVFVISGLIFASAEVYLGRRIKIGAVLRRVGHRFLRCFAGSLLIGLLAVLLVFFSSGFLVIIFRVLLEDASDVVGILLIPFVIVFVTGWFVTYGCFFAAAVLVEGKSGNHGLWRPHELMSGAWWRVVGVMFAILLLRLAVGFIFRIVLGLLLSLTGFLDTMEFLQTTNLTALWQLLTRQPEVSFPYLLIFFVNLGIDIFTMPIWVIGVAVLYFNQRIRKEGFDIEMMATVKGHRSEA
ncbi:hypothetical protein C6500_11400 [Candidatus Poribacteria bacterium]|nr:MAG: hypothetical protein C6500_11400 [Candidatus Poribacteria bacterium]